jgi:replicative DNA helicase
LRLPPVDVEAETSVIGSALLSAEAFDEMALVVSDADFADPVLAVMWRAIAAIREAGRPLDIVLLAERLRAEGTYERIGGAAGLHRLFNAVPNAAHGRYYAGIVRSKSILRQLLLASETTITETYAEAAEPEAILSAAEQRIYAIADRGVAATTSGVDVGAVLAEAIERIEARRGGGLVGMPTGIHDLDEITGGFRRQEFVVIGGRPSMGKTSLGWTICRAASRAGNRVMFVSLEMSALELADRALCMEARVNLHRARSGTISNEDRARLVESAGEISCLPIVFDDTPARRVAQIAALARREQRRSGRLDMIVIDYLQLVEPDSSRDPRQEQVAKIARRLKLLARELNVCVVALAQVNRQSDRAGEPPRLSDLRESGAIEQDADVVVFAHRPAYYGKGDVEPTADAEPAELHVAKQRNGPCGQVDVIWMRRFAAYTDRASERYDGDEWTPYRESSSPGAYDFGPMSTPPAEPTIPGVPSVDTPVSNPANRRDLF